MEGGREGRKERKGRKGRKGWEPREGEGGTRVRDDNKEQI